MFKRRKQSIFEHCVKAIAETIYSKKQQENHLQRRPSLKNFMEFACRDNSMAFSLFPSEEEEENFRLQQKYWGRIRSASMDNVYVKEELIPELDKIELLRQKEDLKNLKKHKSSLKKKNSNKKKQNRVKIDIKSKKKLSKDNQKKVNNKENENSDSEGAALMWPETLSAFNKHRKSRAHSEPIPIIGTVERFEKVNKVFF